MKNIFHGKCTYNGCKARVYTDGLCYKHFTERENKSLEKNKTDTLNHHGFKTIVTSAVHVIAILFIVLLWLACIASSILFSIYCCRILHAHTVKIIIVCAIIIAMAYLVMWGILRLLDKYKYTKYIITVLMLICILILINKSAEIFGIYTDFLENLAYIFTKNMAGILF